MPWEQVIAVFGSSQTTPGQAEYEDGLWLGRRLAELGFAVATGGYSGTMEAVSSGAASVGGRVIGVTAPPLFPHRPGANHFVNEEIATSTLGERIQQLVGISAGTIALPGSIGTATELLLAWNDNFLATMSNRPHRPQVVVGETWRRLVSFLGDHGGAETGLVITAEDVAEAVNLLSFQIAN
jgi:uncharacterized protein (TIGR00725 family)